MGIPNREECLEILVDVGVSQEVLDHMLLVEAIARSWAVAINERHPSSVSVPLVTAGALLHDIGRVETHGIEHVRVGVEMAEGMGIDPRVVEIIRRHVGGGLTKGEAVEMGLPEWDMMPRTIEERIVCHADTLVGGKGRRTLLQTLKHIRRKRAPLYERRVQQLHNHLSGLAEEDLDTIGPWLVD
jgi:uncharacterized protein (TIGR00295 family)